MLRGLDTHGHVIQRLVTSVVTVSKNFLKLDLPPSGVPSLTADVVSTVDVSIQVTNIGSAATYSIDVTDSKGWFKTMSPSR